MSNSRPPLGVGLAEAVKRRELDDNERESSMSEDDFEFVPGAGAGVTGAAAAAPVRPSKLRAAPAPPPAAAAAAAPVPARPTSKPVPPAPNAAEKRAPPPTSAAAALEEPPTSKPRKQACDNYNIDLNAAGYDVCKCGAKKADHEQVPRFKSSLPERPAAAATTAAAKPFGAFSSAPSIPPKASSNKYVMGGNRPPPAFATSAGTSPASVSSPASTSSSPARPAAALPTNLSRPGPPVAHRPTVITTPPRPQLPPPEPQPERIACDNFEVDVTAAEFGACKHCKLKKVDHNVGKKSDKPLYATQGSFRMGGAPRTSDLDPLAEAERARSKRLSGGFQRKNSGGAATFEQKPPAPKGSGGFVHQAPPSFATSMPAIPESPPSDVISSPTVKDAVAEEVTKEEDHVVVVVEEDVPKHEEPPAVVVTDEEVTQPVEVVEEVVPVPEPQAFQDQVKEESAFDETVDAAAATAAGGVDHAQDDSSIPVPVTLDQPKIYIALYEYAGEVEEDLKFAAGDKIEVFEIMDENWMRGRLVGQNVEGIFPKTYAVAEEEYANQNHVAAGEETAEVAVSGGATAASSEPALVEETPVLEEEVVVAPSSQEEPEQQQQQDVAPPPVETDVVVPVSSVLFVAKAKYDFVGETPEDLSFYVDELINVTEVIDENWWRGSIGDRVGLFPASYADRTDDDAAVAQTAAAPVEEEEAAVAANGIAESDATSNPAPPVANEDGYVNLGYATALFDFCAEAADDLSFNVGDQIEVMLVIDPDWLKGRLNGKEGLVPRTYVEYTEVS